MMDNVLVMPKKIEVIQPPTMPQKLIKNQQIQLNGRENIIGYFSH